MLKSYGPKSFGFWLWTLDFGLGLGNIIFIQILQWRPERCLWRGTVWFVHHAGVRHHQRPLLHNPRLVQLSYLDLLQAQGQICQGRNKHWKVTNYCYRLHYRSRTRTPTCPCPPLTGEAGRALWGWDQWAPWAPPSTSGLALSTPRPRRRPITALSMVTAPWGDTGAWARCLDRNQTGWWWTTSLRPDPLSFTRVSGEFRIVFLTFKECWWNYLSLRNIVLCFENENIP